MKYIKLTLPVSLVISMSSSSVLAWDDVEVTFHDLIRVYSGNRVIDAATYYSRFNDALDKVARYEEIGKTSEILAADHKVKTAMQRKLAEIPYERRMLPLVSHVMRPGPPVVRQVSGIYQPFFLMGLDNNSVTWLRSHYRELAKQKATGLIVSADDWSHWQKIKAEANRNGVALTLTPADALANVYGFKTYPLLVITGIAHD